MVKEHFKIKAWKWPGETEWRKIKPREDEEIKKTNPQPNPEMKSEEESTSAPEEESLIEVETPIGVKGREISPEELAKSKKLLSELELEKKIKEKQESGEILSAEEVAKLKELKIAQEIAQEKARKKRIDELLLKREAEQIEKDAEKLVKAMLGPDVFQREEQALRPVKEEIKPVKEKLEGDLELSRKAAEITLARIDNYQDLWAETEQEGDKKFIQKTREVWRDFVVHGMVGIDKKTKKKILLNYTDLDGRCSLGLLKLAGLNTKDVTYVAPGEFRRGKINLDTGGRYGLVLEDRGKTVFMDHHASESGENTSTTKIAYEVLTNLGLLKKEKYLNKLVEFVTEVDNRSYPQAEKYFKDSWRTVLGLQRFIHFKHLLNFFKAGRKPTEILSKDDLKKFGLKKRSKEQKEIVESSWAELKKMESAGLIIPSDRYGKIAVDIGKKVKAGFDAARAYGCGGYIIWNPQEKSFFINTQDNLTDNFLQGKKVRQKIWIKPQDDKAHLTVKLKDILEKMTDGKLEPVGKLKEYLEKEVSPWIEELSKDKVEQEKLDQLFEKALALARKVDRYQGLDEERLREIAVNQVRTFYYKYKQAE
jgi:hypothetical protein